MPEEQPEWFILSEQATEPIMRFAANALENNELPVHLRYYPQMAHWFFGNSLYCSNIANRDGMHANALAITRQCIEAISIIELGLCRHPERQELLERWYDNKASPGKLRQWLADNVWPTYGSGLWDEGWEDFMGKLASAVQPFAHYTGKLADWQMSLQFAEADNETFYARIGPREYDPQKATRITLFHGVLVYTVGRIAVAGAGEAEAELKPLVNRFGHALSNSRYLDGHQTDWDQQFWAMLWDGSDGSAILE